MGRAGSCLDAVAEATFSTIKVEYVHRRQFRSRSEARLKIATWITDFYNGRRQHPVCDWRSPIDYERPDTRALGGPGRITEPPRFQGIDIRPCGERLETGRAARGAAPVGASDLGRPLSYLEPRPHRSPGLPHPP
ncbi:IS3 family transposase [Micromonospora sp. NPDC004540]|uniref:IS3 family transposase n=1 Tax=Micromonospora sp. NPDC004540 TaxID=3154457 RepID=UPI0033BCAE85